MKRVNKWVCIYQCSALLYSSGDFVRINMLLADIYVGFGYFKPTPFSLRRWVFVFTAYCYYETRCRQSV